MDMDMPLMHGQGKTGEKAGERNESNKSSQE
jgi:hypothetical protein